MSTENAVFTNIDILGTPRKCLVRERKVRGTEEVVQHFIPTFEDNESVVDFLVQLFGGSAEKVRNVIIRDVIIPAAVEATSGATNPEGEFSALKYVELLAAYGEPSTRRSGGPSLSDLRERLSQIAPRFLQLVGVMRSMPQEKFVTSPEGLEFSRLYTEQEGINRDIAAKEGAPKKPRKPRAKKDAAAAAPAVAAPEVQ
jgi:hypothetical protein